MLKKFEKEIEETEKKIESIISRKTKGKRPLYNLLFSLIGLTVLLAGSHLLVKSAVSIAASIGVSQMVIGLSIVALGTSLPELVVTVVASIKKEARINLGMVLGSNTFNTLLILGVAALILPIPVEKRDVYINMPIMLLFTIAVFPVLKENIRTYRLMGLFFLLGYFSFIFYSFFG
jgi:cation:H+ antiporter